MNNCCPPLLLHTSPLLHLSVWSSFEFLGLGRRPLEVMKKVASRKQHSNAAAAFVTRKFGPMLPETQALLSAVYAPFNEAFAELVGDTALLYQEQS